MPAFDRVRQATFSWHIMSVAAQRNRFASTPPESRIKRLVAEVDGEVVGMCMGSIHLNTTEKGVGFIYLAVHPGFRGRGAGTALLTPIEEHTRSLGLRKVLAYALDDPQIVAWAQKRGWETGMSARFSAVDPSNLPPMPPTPEGVTIADLSTITAEQFYELDKVASADEPGDVPMGFMAFEVFLNRVWKDPDARHDLSQVALVDGKPVAYTMIEANSDSLRAWSGGTSTLPEFRGRGLAKVLKSIALRKAAAAGITTAITANDYTNAPMLAVNDWLGYKVTDSEVSMLKHFEV